MVMVSQSLLPDAQYVTRHVQLLVLHIMRAVHLHVHRPTQSDLFPCPHFVLPQARGRVVPAPIALTAQEHRILVDRQYRVRESLLV